MADVFDIMLGGDDDLLFEGGDFVIGESTLQHQVALVIDNKGDYKGSPAVCVGANQYIDNEDVGAFMQEIAAQFGGDGMSVAGVTKLADGRVWAKGEYR